MHVKFKKNDLVIYNDSGSKDIRVVKRVTKNDCYFTNGGMAKKYLLDKICSFKEVHIDDLKNLLKLKKQN